MPILRPEGINADDFSNFLEFYTDVKGRAIDFSKAELRRKHWSLKSYRMLRICFYR